MPAMPMAMSVWPSRHGRPNVSLTMTATSAPRAAKPARMRRAEASESSGSSTTRPWAPLELWSMPLLAHTKPWWVSVMSTGPTMRTMRRDSRSTSSTTRGSLSHFAAHSVANPDGVTSSSSTVRPSALDTIFDVTTSTSPSTTSVAAAISAARSSPGRISGNPTTPAISITSGA